MVRLKQAVGAARRRRCDDAAPRPLPPRPGSVTGATWPRPRSALPAFPGGGPDDLPRHRRGRLRAADRRAGRVRLAGGVGGGPGGRVLRRNREGLLPLRRTPALLGAAHAYLTGTAAGADAAAVRALVRAGRRGGAGDRPGQGDLRRRGALPLAAGAGGAAGRGGDVPRHDEPRRVARAGAQQAAGWRRAARRGRWRTTASGPPSPAPPGADAFVLVRPAAVLGGLTRGKEPAFSGLASSPPTRPGTRAWPCSTCPR